MKKLLIVALVFAILGFAAALASGQTPVPNPTKANFTASPDHQAISSYEIGWFLAGATDPVSTVDVGKPAPDTVPGCVAPVPCVEAMINVMPLPFSVYTARVRAKDGTMYSEWSEPSNEWARVPLPPIAPTVKK